MKTDSFRNERAMFTASHERLFDEVLPDICRHFPGYVFSFEERYDERLHALVVCLMYSSYHQHVCFDTRHNPFTDDDRIPGNDTLAESALTLYQKACDGFTASHTFHSIGQAPAAAPLIVSDTRIYLNKYYAYEMSIADFITSRTVANPDYDEALADEGINLLFGSGQEVASQRRGAHCALKKQCSIITGGPGTGKTSTVCKVLLLRALMAQKADKPLSVLMVAPTGKAASRLQQAVTDGIDALLDDPSLPASYHECAASLPLRAYTIHRILYSLSIGQKIEYDLIVIDESSMIDIGLFHSLIVSCHDECSIILLGDSRQLASVQAGSVLSDINRAFDNDTNESAVTLTHSFRFDPRGGIGRASHLITESQADDFITFISSGDPDIAYIDSAKNGDMKENIIQALSFIHGSFESFAAYTDTRNDRSAIDRFFSSSILCAVRKGISGVERCNALVEELLAERGHINARGRIYENMPLLITKNNYLLDVYNGDAGLIRSREGRLVYMLPCRDGVRNINPVMLESSEKCYAMTVHKSQGSEFDGVIILLPDRSPVLSRELLYTAITRARKKVVLIASRESLEYTVTHQTNRMSGLSEMLTRLKAT